MRKFLFAILLVLSFIPDLSFSADCTAQGLSKLASVDLSRLTVKKLEVNFNRAIDGTDIFGYYDADQLMAITASFKGSGGRADMNFYFLDKENYLMEYHALQNSNYYGENDSVILTDERAYYHVCDNKLLSPAFGGIVDDDNYQNMKLMLDIILTEEAAQ